MRIAGIFVKVTCKKCGKVLEGKYNQRAIGPMQMGHQAWNRYLKIEPHECEAPDRVKNQQDEI